MIALRRSALLLLCTLLAACGGRSGASDADVLQLLLSPAAQPAAEAISTCAAAHDITLRITSAYPNTQSLEDYDLAIQLGTPTDASIFAAALTEERLLLIRSTNNPIETLGLESIAAIFSGRIANWDVLGGDVQPINLWITPSSDEARLAFEAHLLGGGSVTGAAHLAATPAILREAAAADQYALGVLPAAWLDASVDAQDLDIALPLMALATAEPQGPARALIGCLQSEPGQNVFAKSYSPLGKQEQ